MSVLKIERLYPGSLEFRKGRLIFRRTALMTTNKFRICDFPKVEVVYHRIRLGDFYMSSYEFYILCYDILTDKAVLE